MEKHYPSTGTSSGGGLEGNEAQKYTLNQLLKQSMSNSIWPPASVASGHVTKCKPVSTKEQQGMHLLLQKRQSQLQAVMQTSSNMLRNSAPVYGGTQLGKATPQQYVFVHAKSNEPPNQLVRHGNVIPHLKPSAREPPMFGGQIQLGQTYKFDVDNHSVSQPSGIILKQQAAALTSSSQRLSLHSNDRGKFIPFSKLLQTQSNTQLNPNQARITMQSKPVTARHSTGMPCSGTSNSNSSAQMRNIATISVPQQKVFTITGADTNNFSTKIRAQQLACANHPLLPVEKTDSEPFDWDEYLKMTNSKAAPHSSFRHVEISLHNGFNPGMKLEVANKSDPCTYWVATLISTCGSLLLLRYDGYGDDRKTDFWADVCTADLHPIGWCAQNGKVLQPPESIRNMHENWAEFLVGNLIGARTAPERLLSGPFRGKTVVEMIGPGMLLEVQDSQHPQHVWMVDVLKNVGGRLLLRYKGLSDVDARHDFWLFYLDSRLHQVGWGKEHRLTMKPPDAIRNKYTCKEQWAYVLSQSLKGVTEQHLVPACVFQDQVKIKCHEIKEKHKLAVLDPIDPTKLRPATVIRVIDEHFFLAELDNLLEQSTSCAFLCHSGSSGVFSVEWCKKYDIPIASPQGYNVPHFDWEQYLKFTGALSAPDTCFSYSGETHQFEPGMKLEACSPYNLYEICVGTIMKIYGNVLHLRLAASLPGPNGQKTSHIKKFVDCFVHSSSQDIFPVGWCHSNNYPLSAPTAWREKRLSASSYSDSFPFKKVAVVQPEVHVKRNSPATNVPSLHSVINPSSTSKIWCPKVCVNCTCKTGIFLNDHDLSKVPRSVGPGNTVLVLKEVLSLLVGAAERPHKLLKDLEDFTLGRWDQPCVVKTKFDGKKYQATLHVVSTATEVPAFFKSLSQFLKCCPNLLSLGDPVTACPLDCKKEKITMRAFPAKGRGRKIMLKRMKPGFEGPPRTVIRTNMRRYVGRSHGFPVMRHITNGYRRRRELKMLRDFLPLSSDMTRSAHNLHSQFNAIKNLRKGQERRKLHRLNLQSNPLHWTIEEVVEFIETTDCAKWVKLFCHHQIDGQAFLLLTLPVIQECLELKLGPSLKIARHVDRVKMAFYEKFSNN